MYVGFTGGQRWTASRDFAGAGKAEARRDKECTNGEEAGVTPVSSPFACFLGSRPE